MADRELGPSGSGGPHFFVDDLGVPSLSTQDRHHAERVLRLRRGDAMTVGDGMGSWRPVRFGPELEAVGDPVTVPRPTSELVVGFALVKGAKPELVIQKLCELGVDRVEPFVADRSVVRWDDAKSDKALERWRAIARSAAMQSRRVRLLEVAPVVRFDDVVVEGAVLADLDGRSPSECDRHVLVGPEGGWSDDERARASERGLDRVRFGTLVLRAETAAIAVGTVAAALRAGLVRPA